MSKLKTWVLILVLLVILPSFAFAESVFVVGDSRYMSDGNIYTMDVAPYIKNGRVFVPVRYLSIACGVPPSAITYNNGVITILAPGNKVIQLTIGSNQLKVNGTITVMDAAPEIVNGRTFLPARWVAEALGYKVSWNELTRSVIIAKKEYSTSEVVSIVQPAVVYIETQRSAGTGFFTSPDGEILTNSHVVAGASFIRVTTFDGRTYNARVEKAIPYLDLAILRVDGTGFPFLPLSSSTPQSGEEILVLGHPLGVKNTVSKGIISNPSKNISEIYPNMKTLNINIMQISAPIYPGNSGGPVVNTSGEAVGVVFAKRSGTDTIAFAIPIVYYNLVQKWNNFDLRTDFDMFVATLNNEWLPYEEVATSFMIKATEYFQSEQFFRDISSLDNAISALEALENAVSSYEPVFPQVKELKNAYLQRTKCLREALIRLQSASMLLRSSIPSLTSTYKVQRLLDEVQYYLEQEKYWREVFFKRWSELSSQLRNY
ncbi:MAG: trypsin-like peptidase domain-containing protein [Thermosediminibacteraceae bacterium]|nr:trypsin-like peptidase domain-containing protein [Thermosediminibacteraceae bacterium]